MSGKAVLIIGEDPSLIDFDDPDAPEGMSVEKVMAGLNGSVARLRAAGHAAALLLTTSDSPLEGQIAQALAGSDFDVIVIGAGLRTLPTMADTFEQIINVIHAKVPSAKLAFNSQPNDSDIAALRWL